MTMKFITVTEEYPIDAPISAYLGMRRKAVSDENSGVKYVTWNPGSDPDENLLSVISGSYAVINLAGASIVKGKTWRINQWRFKRDIISKVVSDNAPVTESEDAYEEIFKQIGDYRQSP